MAAAGVTPGPVVVRLTADAVWVGSATGVVECPDESLSDCLDAIDDEFTDTGGRLLPTVDVLAAAVGRAVGNLSEREGFVDTMTILCPSHWGADRCAVLGNAARRSARDVETVPVALAVPAPAGADGWIVVECAATSTAVVAVRRDRQGVPTIAACALAPGTGTLDLEADSGRIAVLDALVDEVGASGAFGIRLVVGVAADLVAGLLSPAGDGGVRVVPEAALVGGGVRSPGSGSGTAASGPAPTAWLDPVPAPRTARTTGRRVAIGVALVAVLSIVVGAAISVLNRRGVDSSPVTVPLHRVEIGRASIELPMSWQDRGDRSGRLDLVPDDGRGVRIVIVPTELPPGSGHDAVVRGLERKIGERGPAGPFSDFAADVEFGGRRAVGYVESPADGSRVRWFVLVDADVQVSVGCQYRDVGWDAIAADCERVVRGVAVVPAR